MIKLIIAGDYNPRGRISQFIKNKKGYHVFQDLNITIKKADYSIVNLECTILDFLGIPITTGGENLKCSESEFSLLHNVGFKMVTLANNHFRDFGDDGVKNTLLICQKYGIRTVGGGLNLKEAIQIQYITIKDKIFAFINCCEHEFSIASKERGGSNPLNPIQQYYEIQEARKNADYVLVIVHGGSEHFQLPSPRMKETYRFFVDAGADVVINHHQHCFSGYEVYNGSPIFYGLGNFCFDNGENSHTIWNEGYIVELLLENSSIDFNIIPYNQNDNQVGVRLMNENEKMAFNKKIKELNEIIDDDNLLEYNFLESSRRKATMIKLSFEPISCRYFKALRRRKLIPSLISKRTKVNIYNIVNCESYRDIVLEIFKPIDK